MQRRPNIPLVLLAAAITFAACLALGGFSAQAATVEAQGALQIIKRSEQSGNPLSGAVFGVYRASDGQRLADLTTNADGSASLTLEPGEYYLRELKPPYGYMLERERILFTVTVDETVIVEVTNQRDTAISDYSAYSDINIPKTGETSPYAVFFTGSLLTGASLLYGITVILKRKLKAKN